MANPWVPPNQVPPTVNGNAWQYQSTPNMQQDAINYGATHPNWQGYQQIMGGATPAQIMTGQVPSGIPQGSASALAGTGQSTDGSSLQAIWALLQGQNAPQNQAIDTLKQQLGIDVGNETKLTGLKESDLQASTAITMARANKMIQNSELTAQNAKAGMGFTNQLYGEQNKQAGLQYGAQRAALLSDATARGAVNAHGTVGQFQNQYGEFQNQLAGNLTSRNKSLADLQLQESQAQNVAQQYGLDKQALQEKLTNGMQQLGIQGQIDLGDLFKQASSLDAQKAGLAQGMISQLIGLAQGNPSLMNQLPGFMAGGTGSSAGGQGNTVSVGGRGVR